MGKVPALTSIRFIAAFVVFLHHWIIAAGYIHWGTAWRNFDHTMLTRIIYEMRFGVTLFFVLSGFLFAARYFDSIFTKISFKEYWIKRLARIFPLYWSLLTILLVHEILHDRSLQYFHIYYSLTQGFFSHLKFGGLGVAWSLTVEECFYLFLPILVLGLRWIWKAPKLAGETLAWGKVQIPMAYVRYLIMLLILIGVTVLFYQVGRIIHINRKSILDYAGFFRNSDDWRIYTIFGRFFDFAAGVAFGIFVIKSKNFLLTRGWAADLIILASTIVIIILCFTINKNGGLESMDGHILNMVNAGLSGAIIYCLCAQRSFIAKLLSWRPFVYLGEISFAFYLIHYTSMLRPMYIWIVESQFNMFLSIMIPYAIITVLSVMAYEAIERPAQHLILRKSLGMKHLKRPTVLRWVLGKEERQRSSAQVEAS